MSKADIYIDRATDVAEYLNDGMLYDADELTAADILDALATLGLRLSVDSRGLSSAAYFKLLPVESTP